jgi:hypothetical protein
MNGLGHEREPGDSKNAILVRAETMVRGRVARFLVINYTKMGIIYPITTKLPNVHKIYQMAEIYSYWP